LAFWEPLQTNYHEGLSADMALKRELSGSTVPDPKRNAQRKTTEPEASDASAEDGTSQSDGGVSSDEASGYED
jgi:hypothetical protein